MSDPNNPLLSVHELPPFDEIEACQVGEAIDLILAKNRNIVSSLVDIVDEPTWSNLANVLESMDDRINQSFSPISHLNAVVNTPALREAYNDTLPKLSDYETELGQNKALFSAYEKLKQSEEFSTLNMAQKKSVDNAIRDFRLSGINLDESNQTRFSEINKRLSALSAQFNDNVLDATMAWSKLITDVEALRGLPSSALALAQQMAQEKDKQGYLFTLDFPSYSPVLTYCDNQALRQEMYEASTTRASNQGPLADQWDNAGIIIEILTLKKEQANLLGFANTAEHSLATKMAKDTDQVLSFLETLGAKSKPAADREFAELQQFALKNFGVEIINAWDLGYYSEKLKEHKFDISDEALRPYFPAPRVLQGMFEVVRRLYDIEIEQSTEIETWHKDVKTYNIKKEGRLVARFYLDLYARENKQGGAWMDDCRVRRIRTDGTLQLPVAYLTCNFSPSVGEATALLTHNEVVTLFHEFGHGLHHMLTKVECASVSGINGVAWDAVELPSQFMENWCWQEEALQFISGHFETGEPLPRDMLEKMLAAKNFNAGIATVRQLELALFDFRLHLEFDAGKSNQLEEIISEVRNELAVVPAPEFNRFQNSFGHIFGGGYAAGYYSYKWAEVLSADVFSKFESEGIFNRQTGERFLSTVLEQGGSVDAMDMFIAFRGRPPEIDALLKQDGIL